MKEKILIVLLCVVGLASVCYGIVKDNDSVFIMGIIFVIVGYVMIRKKISDSIKEKG